MKFRGLMIDNASMKEFLNIANSVSKLAKDCVMRLTERKIYFIISVEDVGPKSPLVWCELPVPFYFKEYNLVGFNEEHNEIYLELSTAMFSRTLQTLKQPTRSLKMKLTDKQTPCITLEIQQVAGENAQNRQLIYDIPVDVIDVKYWSNYKEPTFNDFHVSIEMPPLRLIKNIVERMKHMSHNLIVSADQFGNLMLKIESNMVSLATHFCNLNVHSFAVDEVTSMTSNRHQENQMVSASVDIKKFLMFLTGMQVTNYKAMCNIVQDKMIKIFLEQPGVLSFQIFLTELII